MKTVTIKTDWLILRKATENDIPAAFCNWMSDEKSAEFLRHPAHRDISVTENALKKWIGRYKDLDYYRWVIILKEINEPIGTISAGGIDEKTKKINIGYCIGSRWWHCGYTSEALTAALTFFFEQVKVKRIEGQHDPNNPNSGKVMKKCGMLYEGTLRQADWSNKGIVDTCIYGIVAADYWDMAHKSCIGAGA